MSSIKLVYVLIDGVGDLPDPRLGGKTPLEAALTPNLDSLATRGAQGLVYAVGKGIAPESDVAVFHMLGYKLSDDYPGRGVIESVGAGIDFRDGDLALRANFATVDENMKIIDRRAGRDLSNEEAEELAKSLNEQVKVSVPNTLIEFRHTVAHRLVVHVRVRGARLSANITNTDPAYERVSGMGVAKTTQGPMFVEKARPLDESREAELAARIVNEITEKSYRILNEHPVNVARRSAGKLPANIILMRDAGDKLPKMPGIEEKYGLRMAAIADMPVEIGIARLTGMHVETSPGIEEHEWKAEKTAELLRTYDAVYVHLKGPDEPGHDGLPEKKKQSIEGIDSEYFGSLLRLVDLDKTLVVVSADHATPCQLKAHSGDPVPLLVSGKNVVPDDTRRFTEREAARGSLGVLEGYRVLETVVSRYLKKQL